MQSTEDHVGVLASISQHPTENNDLSLEEQYILSAQKVAHLSPLRYYHRAPIPRFNYGLDHEEREIIKKGANMSKEQIWALLERKRFRELQKAAVNLQGELLVR